MLPLAMMGYISKNQNDKQKTNNFDWSLYHMERYLFEQKASAFYILKNVLLDNQAFYSQNIISYEIHQFLIAFHAINIQ